MLRNADGGGRCQIFQKKVLRRCKFQRYYNYEGEVGVKFHEKNVT